MIAYIIIPQSSLMVSLLVAERPAGDVERPFRLHSEFTPAGDQPQAIDELCEGIAQGERASDIVAATLQG